MRTQSPNTHMSTHSPIPASSAFLSRHEMAEILRYAFEEFEPLRSVPHLPVILSTLALTGAREREVLGVRMADVDLDRRVLYIRENRWRGLKSQSARRALHIPSQLERILRDYLAGNQGPQGELLFPGENRAGNEAMIQDLRRAYDQMPMPEARLPGVALRPKILRHTWCAARLQTLDKGAPVSIYTVAEEMGHKDTEMIKRIYGHLGEVRHRGEEVGFPFEPSPGRQGQTGVGGLFATPTPPCLAVLSENEISGILRYAFEELEPPSSLPHLPVILAVLALTGARPWEVLGLQVADVDLRARVVRIRPNEYRALKSRTHARAIRMVPQLRGVLSAYLAWPARAADELLFPFPGGPAGRQRALQALRGCWQNMPMPAPLRGAHTVRGSTVNRAGTGAESRLVGLSVLRRSWFASRLRRLAHGDHEGLLALAQEYGLQCFGHGAHDA